MKQKRNQDQINKLAEQYLASKDIKEAVRIRTKTFLTDDHIAFEKAVQKLKKKES